MESRDLPIINKLGLHARAATKFVTLASRFGCAIQVARNGRTVNGKSIMGIMMLAAAKGTSITVSADGDDEASALDALAALVADRFEEEE
ncbi:HPr family phosphocarrier protein [Endothiovibrio diazotrophicus]